MDFEKLIFFIVIIIISLLLLFLSLVIYQQITCEREIKYVEIEAYTTYVMIGKTFYPQFHPEFKGNRSVCVN